MKHQFYSGVFRSYRTNLSTFIFTKSFLCKISLVYIFDYIVIVFINHRRICEWTEVCFGNVNHLKGTAHDRRPQYCQYTYSIIPSVTLIIRDVQKTHPLYTNKKIKIYFSLNLIGHVKACYII